MLSLTLATVLAALLRLVAQVGIVVNVPSEVGPGDPVLVQIEVTAPAGRDVRIDAPSFAPFRLVTTTFAQSSGSGPNAQGWQTIEYRYVLAAPPSTRGDFTFKPFVAHVTAPGLREAIARSGPWRFSVRAPNAAAIASTGAPDGRVPAIVDRARIEPSTGINFHALATPDTVYVGQQSTYQVAVFLDENVRTRLRRNPEFLPPELRGLLAYELPAGRTSLRDRVIAGKRWDVHVFQRAVFPLEPGRTDVPRAQLSYSLPLSLGFFSREESYTARSEPATIVAIAPPTAGRPADWTGAVGVLRATTRIDTTSARVGDPMVLTLRVEGTANVKLLPRPPLSLPWATAVVGDERVSVDSSALLVRGAKEFDWIVTPRAAGDQVVAPVRYPYFDPYARRYDVAIGQELQVHVTPGTLAASATDSATPSSALSIRAVDRGPVRAPLPSRPLFWLLVLAAPLPAVVLLAARRPRRVARAVPAAATLREVARSASDVRAVRRAFGVALAERLAMRDAGTALVSARAGVLARRLRRAGVTRETAADVESHVHALDVAAYANGSAGRDAAARALAARSTELYARVDAEARSRVALAATRLPRHRVAMLLVLAIATAGAARAIANVATPFALGVEAYDGRRYVEAARYFRDAAVAERRSADAWANAGTSAWALSDTVNAAIGWQRALRLEPRAPDIRARLFLLSTPQDGRIAGVPPVPLDWAVLGALGLWIAACTACALRLAERAREWPMTALGVTALLGATVSTLLSTELARVESGKDLAVVRVAGPLRAEPTLGAELAGRAEATDVARVLARRDVWSRVALDGRREGWIASDQLAPLD